MPSQSDSRELGKKAEEWLAFHLPPKWNIQPPKTDVGIDGVVVICDETELNGLEFRVQVKSSAKWPALEAHAYQLRLKKSTLRYWFASPLPLLLVLFNHSSQSGEYVWHDQLWSQLGDLSDATGKETTVRIEHAKPLTDEGWATIRRELHEHYSALARTFAVARTARAILSAVHSLAGAVKGLAFAHLAQPMNRPPTDEQENLLYLMDVVCHRDAIVALSNFRDTLPAGGPGAKMIAAFLKGYAAEVCTFVYPFDVSVLSTADAAVRINPDRMRRLRPRLMEALLDTIEQLTAKGESSGDTHL